MKVTKTGKLCYSITVNFCKVIYIKALKNILFTLFHNYSLARKILCLEKCCQGYDVNLQKDF